MKKVTSADMARKFSELCDMALNEPIVVTKNGRERLVLLGIGEYKFLRHLASDKPLACKDPRDKTAANAARGGVLR